MTGPAWRRYLRFWRADLRADVDDELAFHVESRVQEYVAAGMSPDAARREALQRFGDVERVRVTVSKLFLHADDLVRSVAQVSIV